MDYSTYFLSKKEMMVCIGKGILAGMLAAWILYQSVYGMVTVFIFIPLCIQREKKKRREQQKETLLLQFRDAMQSVAAALQAGYSMENAWRESEKEMTELYGQDVMRLRAELERHGLMNALESDVDCIVTGNFAVCLSRIFEKERGDWCSY